MVRARCAAPVLRARMSGLSTSLTRRFRTIAPRLALQRQSLVAIHRAVANVTWFLHGATLICTCALLAQDFAALVAGFEDTQLVLRYLDDHSIEYEPGLSDHELKKMAIKHKQKQILLSAAGESCLKDPIADPSKRDLSVKNLKKAVSQSTKQRDNFSVKGYLQSLPPMTCRLKHSLDPGEATCRGTVLNGKCLQCNMEGVTGVYGYSSELVIADDAFDDQHSMVLKICDAAGFALFGCKATEFMGLDQATRAEKQCAVMQEYFKFTVMVMNADKQNAVAICTGAEPVVPATPTKTSEDKNGSSTEQVTDARGRKRRANE